MRKIESFRVDHRNLNPGIYISRIDRDDETGAYVTTFDLRLTSPNREPVIDTAAIHAIEHIGATFLRNDAEWYKKIIYFGPMGCRTGFYLVVFGNLREENIIFLVKRMFSYIKMFKGDVPGATPEECGNYHDSDANMASWYASRYLDCLDA